MFSLESHSGCHLFKFKIRLTDNVSLFWASGGLTDLIGGPYVFTGIDYMVEAVNVYLNEWLQVTLPQDCQQMCSIVDPQHNSTCQFYCNVYGVYGFIQIISRVDIDPIYMCQLEKKCPIQACAQPTCATISSIKLSPSVPKSGDTVTVTGYYTVTGEAGAGMLRLMSSTPAGTL